MPPLVTEEPEEPELAHFLQEYLGVMISMLILCTVIVMASLLYRFWQKSSQLFTQKIPHTTLSMTLFGNGDCVSVQILKTSVPLLLLKLAVPDDPQQLPLPNISLGLAKLHVDWQGLAMISTDQHMLKLPRLVPVKLSKIFKTRKILHDLREVQLVVSSLEEYAHMHTWFSPMDNDMPLFPCLMDPVPDDPEVLPQELPESQ